MPNKTENLELNIYSRNERVVDWLNGTDDNFQIIDDTIGKTLSKIEEASQSLANLVNLTDNYGSRVNIINDAFPFAYNTENNDQYSGGVLVEDKIYIFDTDGYYIYDIKTNTFSFNVLSYSTPSLDFCKNSYKFHFASKIYMLGYDTTTVYTFNLITNEFRNVDIVLPYKVKKSSFIQDNTKIYCFGSEYNNSSCFVYDMYHNTIRTITSPNLYDVPVCINHDKTLVYLLGATPYKFDVINETFTSMSISGINKSNLAYSNMLNFGIIFSGNSTEIYRFDTIEETLTKINTELPHNLIGGTSIYYHNAFYLFGGSTENGIANQYFYQYIDF